MKFKGSYSECFYQVRNGLRSILANDFKCAELFLQHNVLDLDLICGYADDLTAFNEVSGLPFFVRFSKFNNSFDCK